MLKVPAEEEASRSRTSARMGLDIVRSDVAGIYRCHAYYAVVSLFSQALNVLISFELQAPTAPFANRPSRLLDR